MKLLSEFDWRTGELEARWSFPDDSRVRNAFGTIIAWLENGVLENGDLLIGAAFGIGRVIR